MYSARTPAGTAWSFGTSGLLYRSNKLMYDRQSFTLWSNLTGEPVVGRLAASPVRLEMLSVAVSTWGEWRRRHPDTSVLRLPDSYGARFNFEYRPGAADRARAGVSFPTWRKSRALEAKTEVFGLRIGGGAKAYPIDAVSHAGTLNDLVGTEPVLLVGDRASGAIRAYRRGEHTFRSGERPTELVDETGAVWRIEEDALQPTGQASGTAALPRIAGHVSFWFAWFGFFPETEVYEPGR